MKRIATVVALTAAAGIFAVAPATAAGAQLCYQYDININGTAQAGAACLPE